MAAPRTWIPRLGRVIPVLPALLLGGSAGARGQATSTSELWYDEPASAWIEALPIGNGRPGAKQVLYGDEAFLRDTAYPLMKGAAEFYLDWLVDNGDGYLVTPVGTSPENQFLYGGGKSASVSMGPTMDMAIIRELFSRTARASGMLGVDPALRAELRTDLARLLPYRIGKYGQLQEWQEDFEEQDVHHRHMSPLLPTVAVPRGQAVDFATEAGGEYVFQPAASTVPASEPVNQ